MSEHTERRTRLPRWLSSRADRVHYVLDATLLRLIPDQTYVNLCFRKKFGRWPDLHHPRTFNEHLIARMISERDPLLVETSDKLAVKQYVSDIAGEACVVPTLRIFESPETISYDGLPPRFMLKANHGSGMNRLIDTRVVPLSDARKLARVWMRRNYYLRHREWPYSQIERKVFAEEYLEPIPPATFPASPRRDPFIPNGLRSRMLRRLKLYRSNERRRGHVRLLTGRAEALCIAGAFPPYSSGVIRRSARAERRRHAQTRTDVRCRPACGRTFRDGAEPRGTCSRAARRDARG